MRRLMRKKKRRMLSSLKKSRWMRPSCVSLRSRADWEAWRKLLDRRGWPGPGWRLSWLASRRSMWSTGSRHSWLRSEAMSAWRGCGQHWFTSRYVVHGFTNILSYVICFRTHCQTHKPKQRTFSRVQKLFLIQTISFNTFLTRRLSLNFLRYLQIMF